MSLSKRILSFALLTLLLTASILSLSLPKTMQTSSVFKTGTGKPIVVIDAGHGGFDSGKIGIDGTLEKDINLSIAKKLRRLLLAADVSVIMTRTTDTDLSDTNTGKKMSDMFNRIKLMNDAAPDCIVSIHQNSYPETTVDGAQVFFYAGSAEGAKLAALIQKQLIQTVDPSNHRQEKPDSSYYLLKNAAAPIAIAECGFLSNPAESKKLADDTYQQALAWAIHLGILQYLNEAASNLHTLR